MKIKRFMLSLALAAVTIVGAGASASAANVCYCIQGDQPAGIVMYECNRELVNYGKDTHNYWSWNPLGTKTCTFTIYKSTGKEFCSKCGYVYSVGTPHHCRYAHQNCGDGTEDVCIVGGKDPWSKAKQNVNETE